MVVGYLLYRRAVLQKRLRASWPAIVQKLGIGADEIHADAREIDRQFSNKVVEERARSGEGRRQMFREAGVMLQMADYAERNGASTVAPVVASLRAHALAIRVEIALSSVGLGRQCVPGSGQ